MRNFYQEVKKSKGHHSIRPYYLINNEGDTEGNLNRFVRYFLEVLNDTEIEENRTEYKIELNTEINEIISTQTTKEIEKCTQQQRNNKGAGESNTVTDILKRSVEALMTRIWYSSQTLGKKFQKSGIKH